MKIIFLDIDGVLNSARFFEASADKRKLVVVGRDSPEFWSHMLDPSAVAVLSDIVARTGAKIVVSSSWRNMHRLSDIGGYLKMHGFKGHIIDSTPKRAPEPPYIRGNEIQAWLDSTTVDVEKFVIIDDDSDMGRLKPHLVQTSNGDGLLPKHVDDIVERLR